MCIQPSFIFCKKVQSCKERGCQVRNWMGGWIGGKIPAHSSQPEIKRQGSCNSFAFIGHRLIRLLKRSSKLFKVSWYYSNTQANYLKSLNSQIFTPAGAKVQSQNSSKGQAAENYPNLELTVSLPPTLHQESAAKVSNFLTSGSATHSSPAASWTGGPCQA